MSERESLPREEAEPLARKIALDRLAERDRSRKELRDALVRRRIPDDVIEPLLDKLITSGLQDDERFARSWVESRRRSKGLARVALQRELRLKGIADEVLESVLADWNEDDERQTAHRLVQRRLQGMAHLDPPVQQRRLVSFLQRKGYPPSVVFDVVREELADHEQLDTSDWSF